ncbi:MAG: Dabb family protein [Acidimicrobiia bacterium]|nr:Dabb family protein [Acidimicrobiia bacterium]
MFRHVALFRWAEGTTADEVRAVEERLAALPDVIPDLLVYTFGRDAGLSDTNHDFAVIAEFASVDGFLSYRDHPSHRAVLEDVIKPILEQRAALQFETPEPRQGEGDE